MNHPVTAKPSGKTRILLAPLDWGLGHATRCIPIIRELQNQGCEVFVAAEGMQLVLLQQEFPGLMFLPLDGYRAKYAKTKAGLFWQMIFQSFKFLRMIKKENVWLRKILEEHAFDAVISDNRYGLYSDKITSVFVTHQLAIKSPLGRWSEKLLQKRNYQYIRRFSACWVPDEENQGLAGELSHPAKKPPVPLTYLGHLSRFFQQVKTDSINKQEKEKVLILLSGPEPQRTIFENRITEQLTGCNEDVVLVRGLPGHPSVIPSTGNILFYNHLPAAELEKEMQKATFIISRSGYSTVMDIAALQKKSILVPTPGQTEQEYLAAYLSGQQFAYTVSQKEFSLQHDLEKAKKFSYRLPALTNNGRLREVIHSFLASLR